MPWWESNPKLTEIAKFSIIEELTITAKELGRGSYGTVYAAVHNGKPCVAKEMHPYLKHDKLENFVREINTLSTLKHPSIVQFLGVYFKTKSHMPILVMEVMWKNLYSLLEEQPKQLFLLTKVRILHDVACGLQYLHSQRNPVVHRDLRPSNILLNENLNAKIADLGDARPLHNEVAQKLSTVPDNAYMAPEALKKKPTYDTKLDVFSIGCTIIHIVIEKFPAPTDQFIASKNFEGSFCKVSEADRRIEYLNLMKHVPVLQQIACSCLEDSPNNRPIASYICKELEEYIQKLESEAPVLAKQHKQDKFSLLQLFQSQETQLESKRRIIEDVNKDKSMLNSTLVDKEEYISSLESQCQEYKSKLEENEVTIFDLNQEKESIQRNLDEENKYLTTTYKNKVDQLNENIKTKEEEIKRLTIENKELQLKVSKLQTEAVNLKEHVNTKQGELEKFTSKIEILEQAISNSANYEEEKTGYANLLKQLDVELLESSQLKIDIVQLQEENQKLIQKQKEEKAANLKRLKQMDAEWFKQKSQLKTEFVKLQEEYQKLIEKQKLECGETGTREASESESSDISGTDKPTIKLLNRKVRDKITLKWEDLGVELLNDKQCVMLEIIKKNNRDDVQGCCTQMFIYWLKVDIEASWNKLIEALKEIRQNSLAMEIITDILKKATPPEPDITEKMIIENVGDDDNSDCGQHDDQHGHNDPVDKRMWTAVICTCSAGLIGYYVAGEDVRSKVINGLVCAAVTGVIFDTWRV